MLPASTTQCKDVSCCYLAVHKVVLTSLAVALKIWHCAVLHLHREIWRTDQKRMMTQIILNLKKQSVYHNYEYNCTEELYHLNHFQNDFFQLMNDKNIGGTTEALLSVTFETAIFKLICYMHTVVHTFPDICFWLMPFLKLMMIHWATSSEARWFFLTCPTKTDSFQFRWLLALREGQQPTFKNPGTTNLTPLCTSPSRV